MPSPRSEDDAGAPAAGNRAIVLAASTCAAAVLASQLAGKAARDAIFLQQFAITNLPLLLAVSSALAIATTFWFARRLSRGVPTRVVQIANLVSAVLLVVEWVLLDFFPKPIATVIYMHQTLIGPILVSGFWSIISECFDPRTARKVVGTIGTGATVGGLIGAVLAERIAALVGTEALLPAIAALQLVAAWRFSVLARCGTAAVAVEEEPEHPPVADVAEKISKVPLLRGLAIITVIVTVTAALLDYLFKSAVTEQVPRDDLARVFAVFHGVVGLLTAVVSWLLGRRALQSWGLARTLATLPGSTFVFSAIALFVPGFPAFAALRGAENVVRNSLYREAYEVFFTPLLAADRRATKTVIDVGVERLGDVIGGLAVLAILALVADPQQALLPGAIALSAVGIVVALRAHGSYVAALEHSLLARAEVISEDDAREAPDRTTRATLEMVARTSGSWPAARTDAFADLRSGDPAKIRRALSRSLSPVDVAVVLPLLARADIAAEVERALVPIARRCVGQLTDAARDPALAVAARVCLPALIASAGGELATAGLISLLGDPEPEVRFRAAEALLQLREGDPELAIDPTAVFDGVRRELAANLADPAALHLSTLLALALPAEPVKTAFQALLGDDTDFRGLALEYLDNVLPGDIRDSVWIALAVETPTAPTERRSVETVRADLLRSQAGRVA